MNNADKAEGLLIMDVAVSLNRARIAAQFASVACGDRGRVERPSVLIADRIAAMHLSTALEQVCAIAETPETMLLLTAMNCGRTADGVVLAMNDTLVASLLQLASAWSPELFPPKLLHVIEGHREGDHRESVRVVVVLWNVATWGFTARGPLMPWELVAKPTEASATRAAAGN